MAAQRITTIAGDVGIDGLGLSATDRDVLASCDIFLHSAAAVSFDSPLDSAVEINLLGPTRVAQLLQDLDVRPHLVSVSTCYVAGNRRGTAPEELVSAGPFDLGLDWRDRGGRRPSAARRCRGGEPPARTARRAAQGGSTRAGRRRRAGVGREDGAAARALGARPADRRRPGQGRERRLARRLRVHEGARRAGVDGRQGRRAGEHRAPVDHRVRAAPSRGLAGSAGSGWPSRCSSPTPGVCCASSRACPKGRSTSSPSTSSSPRSSRSPRSDQRRRPPSARSPRVASTR